MFEKRWNTLGDQDSMVDVKPSATGNIVRAFVCIWWYVVEHFHGSKPCQYPTCHIICCELFSSVGLMSPNKCLLFMLFFVLWSKLTLPLLFQKTIAMSLYCENVGRYFCSFLVELVWPYVMDFCLVSNSHFKPTSHNHSHSGWETSHLHFSSPEEMLMLHPSWYYFGFQTEVLAHNEQ